MHGLIFVTWEKYLSERFGSALLHQYRTAIGETAVTAPLASRVYDDATLLAGVGVACQLTNLSADVLLREYGHYFMLNGLTSHLCAYLLNQVHSGRDLLLTMRMAHTQMRRTPDELTPPLFGYEPLLGNPDGLVLIYESPRKICPVLRGAIEGAAERYGEQVQLVERTCMKDGAGACRFEVIFSSPLSHPLRHAETPEQRAHQRTQQQLADLVLSMLPHEDGVTLGELHAFLQRGNVNPHAFRPSVLLKALRHLQFVGLVASSANQPGDELTYRRYWRAPTSDNEPAWEGQREWSSRQPSAPHYLKAWRGGR